MRGHVVRVDRAHERIGGREEQRSVRFERPRRGLRTDAETHAHREWRREFPGRLTTHRVIRFLRVVGRVDAAREVNARWGDADAKPDSRAESEIGFRSDLVLNPVSDQDDRPGGRASQRARPHGDKFDHSLRAWLTR